MGKQQQMVRLFSLRRVALLITFLALPGIALFAQSPNTFDSELKRYEAMEPNDAITRLQRRIDSGEVKLKYDPQRGYLPSVLKALGISTTSQLLVFSKTSFQRDRISPKSPRALYFNEEAYIGYVQNGPVVEVSTVDPVGGAAFYTLSQDPVEKPRFIRQVNECLHCHATPMTKNVPGHMQRSVYAMASGQPDFRSGGFVTLDDSPMRERWGGWYVTGFHGQQRHLGNSILKQEGRPESLDMDRFANLKDVTKLIDATPYLTPHSDIVALMVAEHQTTLQNLITKARYETEAAVDYESTLNKELGRAADYRSESTESRICSVCEPLVDGLLQSKALKLTDPIESTSGFDKWYSQRGPKDKFGRSLHQLDLKTRLFKFSCSPVIYSPLFNSLPSRAKEYVLRRLSDVLSDKDQTPSFSHLSSRDRKAILQILIETLPSFANFQRT
jgi:hypothetical protein